MKIVKFILNLLGEVYRDLVVSCEGEYVEFTYKEGCFTYKNILPFNMTLGDYKFLKSKDFYASTKGE